MEAGGDWDGAVKRFNGLLEERGYLGQLLVVPDQFVLNDEWRNLLVRKKSAPALQMLIAEAKTAIAAAIAADTTSMLSVRDATTRASWYDALM